MSPKSDVNQYLPILTAGIQKVFETKTTLTLEPPASTKLRIVEYNEQMRIVGMEKFQAATFIAVSTLTYPKGSGPAGEPCGVFLMYVPEENAPMLLKPLGHGDPDSAAEVQKAVVEICKKFLDNFIAELGKNGYAQPLAAEPQGYYNEIFEGIPYDMAESEKLEVLYKVGAKKLVAFELTLAPLSRR